jgi:hypothetical protein
MPQFSRRFPTAENSRNAKSSINILSSKKCFCSLEQQIVFQVPSQLLLRGELPLMGTMGSVRYTESSTNNNMFY